MLKLKFPQGLYNFWPIKKRLLQLILFFITVLSSQNSWSQLSETHQLPPFYSGVSAAGIMENKEIYLSTPSASTILVIVTDEEGNFVGAGNGLSPVAGEYKFSNDSPFTLRLLHSLEANKDASKANSSIGTVVNWVEKGLKFVSTDEFYVNFKVNSVSHVGTLISEGIAAKGKRFTLGGSPNRPAHCIMSIMATEDDTIIDVIDPKSRRTTDIFQFTLNKGESYILVENDIIETLKRNDLIGVAVNATRSIAVTLVCSTIKKKTKKEKSIKTIKNNLPNSNTVSKYFFGIK